VSKNLQAKVRKLCVLCTTPIRKMNERGESAMGFSQTTTTHHFFLKPEGGAIRVEVKDPADVDGRNGIRVHLAHIAEAFQKGDFDIPMFVMSWFSVKWKAGALR
jgi:hypothetical protein